MLLVRFLPCCSVGVRHPGPSSLPVRVTTLEKYPETIRIRDGYSASARARARFRLANDPSAVRWIINQALYSRGRSPASDQQEHRQGFLFSLSSSHCLDSACRKNRKNKFLGPSLSSFTYYYYYTIIIYYSLASFGPHNASSSE